MSDIAPVWWKPVMQNIRKNLVMDTRHWEDFCFIIANEVKAGVLPFETSEGVALYRVLSWWQTYLESLHVDAYDVQWFKIKVWANLSKEDKEAA